MRCFILLFLGLFSINATGSNAISCGDAMSVGNEAKMALHSQAQKRAQKAIEQFVEKKLTKPYINLLGQRSNAKAMGALIEVYWCETPSTPLHSAYYRYYSNNKSAFK